MIPEAFITEWSLRAPWPSMYQIEQDLILSRLTLELAQHPVLASELAFRGGTCLHHIYLDQPLRYSEDLDFVRTTNTPIGPILDAIRSVGAQIGLKTGRWKIGHKTSKLLFHAESTDRSGTMRIKVEMNTRETDPWQPYAAMPYMVDSSWWHGSGKIRTFVLEEILATKMRALFQRKKGRDLFDLWIGFHVLDANLQDTADCFRHYVSENQITGNQFERNLEAKLLNSDFHDDLEPLLVQKPTEYSVESAADFLIRELIGRI